MSDRLRAALCLAGVAGLTSAWLLGGLLTDGFDPVRQSISQLQRDGATTSAVLTAGFAGFGLGGLAFARLLPRPPALALRVAAVAALRRPRDPLVPQRSRDTPSGAS